MNMRIKEVKIVKEKSGQMFLGLSFNMMFSLFLIVFFVIIAFIVINAFLKTQKCAQVGLFIEDFEIEIERAWNSQSQLRPDVKFTLPSGVSHVCFSNLSAPLVGGFSDIGRVITRYDVRNTMFLYPPEQTCDMARIVVRNLDLEVINSDMNPYCIMAEDGKVLITIEKKFNERNVLIR